MSTSPSPSVAEALDALADGVREALHLKTVAVMDDDELLALTGTIERLGRAVDALRVTAAGELGQRSRPALGSESLAARKGCRNAIELLRRVTLVSSSTASSRLTLGAETRTRQSLSGDPFPARFARVASALALGRLGLDAASAIVRGLAPLGDRVGFEQFRAAEGELVASATGTEFIPVSETPADDTAALAADVEAATDLAADPEFIDSPDAPLPATADEILAQAHVWRAVLDPDGLEPAERQAMAKRAFSRGRLRDGLVHGRYALLPEIAAKLERCIDAYMSPRTAGVFLSTHEAADEAGGTESTDGTAAAETRTPDQQRHDILAAMVDSVARSGEAPTIGGAAPTVLVSVRADDLTSGHGAGHVDGTDAPISIRSVRQFACAGGIQPVRIDTNGQIIELGSPQRSFTPQQRRAITLRDGGCVIPGCRVPAAWCEIHHVTPAAHRGPTHTGNGVLLCWFHHRTIDSSGWQIRMHHGAPQIKAPPWLGDTAQWRAAGRSPTAAADRMSQITARATGTG